MYGLLAVLEVGIELTYIRKSLRRILQALSARRSIHRYSWPRGAVMCTAWAWMYYHP